MGVIVDMKTLLDSGTYLGDMPDTPDNVQVLFETGGNSPDLTLDGNSVYENPTFQVRVRNTSYASGITACETIKAALAKVSNVTINGSKYLLVRQTTDILPLGRDTKNRIEFSMNFRCVVAK